MSDRKLRKDLRKQQATDQEIAELSELVDVLGTVNPPGLSPAARQRIANRLPVDVDLDQPKTRHTLRWVVAGAGGFAVVFMVIGTSLVQSALPGSALYNIKRGGEEIRSFVQPGFRESLVNEREKELEQLEQQPAVQPEILKKAEQEYERSYERSRDHNKEQKRDDNSRSDKSQKFKTQSTQEKKRQFESRFNWNDFRRSGRDDSDDRSGGSSFWQHR